MSGFLYETAFHWTGVCLYIAAVILFAHAVIFAHPGRVRWGCWAAAAGLVPHTVALILRYQAVGHGPYMMKYEVLSSNAWITVAMLLLFLWRRPAWAPVALGALPFAILMVGFGLFTDPEAHTLPPTLRSMWLVFHVLFNKLAVGAFVLSVASAGALLRAMSGAPAGRLRARLPGPEALEVYTVRFIGFGFVFWTTTIGMGAIWANQSWGRYWGWDPIESWSLVTWLAYAILLHARVFFRTGARATAWGALSCFALSILTILIFPFIFPSMHSAYFQ